MKRSILAILVAIGLAAAFSFAQYSGGGGAQTFTVPTLNVTPGPLTVNGVEVGGAVASGTQLVTVNGPAADIVDIAGMGDPCAVGGTVSLDVFLLQVPSDATSFTFQTSGQAAAQTGLALGDTVTLTNDAPTNGICDDVGALVSNVGATGGTRDGVVVATYINLSDVNNVCGGCGGP